MTDNDLPDRCEGTLGETPGETLMRALDNMQRLEAHEDGAHITRVIVAFEVTHPPTDESPTGGHTLGYDCTPGMGAHDTVGMLALIEDAARYTN